MADSRLINRFSKITVQRVKPAVGQPRLALIIAQLEEMPQVGQEFLDVDGDGDAVRVVRVRFIASAKGFKKPDLYIVVETA